MKTLGFVIRSLFFLSGLIFISVLPVCNRHPQRIIEIVEQPDSLTSPDQKGRMDKSGFGMIVRLKGSPAEIGYNYGYLLAPQIVSMINGYVLWEMENKGQTYTSLEARVNKNIYWEPSVESEITEMIRGISDRLPASARMVGKAGGVQHEITSDDIKIFNTLADWARLGCSSFAVWDSATADGTALVARNLDWGSDPSQVIKENHVVVSYSIPGRKNWVSIGFCGFIGCLSGMNEDGMCVMMQDGNGYNATDTTGLVPRGLVLRKMIESMGTTDNAATIDSYLDSTRTLMGNNIMICFPAKGSVAKDVGMVMEYDGYSTRLDGRSTPRLVSDNPTLGMIDTIDYSIPYDFMILNVNHFLKRNNVSAGGFSSDLRYNDMHRWLDESYKTGKKIDVATSLSIMGGGAVGRADLTLHTMIFMPDSLKMRLYFASKGLPSYKSTGYDFLFSELF